MAISWVELLLITFSVVIVVVITWIRRRERMIENLILALIRSKNGTTIDDIIITVHISAEKAIKKLNKLIARGVVKATEREGKTYM
jgi:predicted transcriptional regulator